MTAVIERKQGTVEGLSCDSVDLRLGARTVIESLDLTLPTGRFTVFIGPNGAGKTTLLRGLAGLIRPVRGAIRLDNEDVGALSPGRRARKIAYLPQHGTLSWPLPVGDVVALGRLPYGERIGALPPNGRRAVGAALAAVGLSGFERRPASALSGGERSRVLLARALATEAQVLLADEPVAALDPRHQIIVLDVLRSLARSGILVAAVMHDLNLAARFADTIVFLDKGKVLATGSPADVLTPERLAEGFGIDALVTELDGFITVAPRLPLPRPEGV